MTMTFWFGETFCSLKQYYLIGIYLFNKCSNRLGEKFWWIQLNVAFQSCAYHKSSGNLLCDTWWQMGQGAGRTKRNESWRKRTSLWWLLDYNSQNSPEASPAIFENKFSIVYAITLYLISACFGILCEKYITITLWRYNNNKMEGSWV